LDPGALRALHPRSLPGGPVVQRPARVRQPVPAGVGAHDRMAGQSGPEPSPLQHAGPGLAGLGDHAPAPGPGHDLRLPLLRLRAGAGDGRLRVAGLQVMRGLQARGPRARILAAWAVALVTGALAYG